MISKVFYTLFITTCIGLFISAIIIDSRHEDLHLKEGYETIGVIQTDTRTGLPKFFKIIKYKDGCEDRIGISGSEYFSVIND